MSMRPQRRTLTSCTKHGTLLQTGAWENAARAKLFPAMCSQPQWKPGAPLVQKVHLVGQEILPRHKASLLRGGSCPKLGPETSIFLCMSFLIYKIAIMTVPFSLGAGEDQIS